jgi:hypothetical protein
MHWAENAIPLAAPLTLRSRQRANVLTFCAMDLVLVVLFRYEVVFEMESDVLSTGRTLANGIMH